MTHRHDDFECLSLRDYVDTKSSLPYEQNPYSTHWVRSGSCHRETSLGYDTLPAITRLWANKNMRLHHDATTPQCSKLKGWASLPHLVQPWVAVPSPAWLSFYIASWPCHPGSAVASMTRHHHRQHDSLSTSHHSQVASTVLSPAIGTDETPILSANMPSKYIK
jgi:hypothetical protein